MFDYLVLQNNAEDPTLIGIIFTVLFSFLLSSLLAFTYENTTRGVSRPGNFLQAMVLISMVSAMVMQAIGDSLARGLGMLGALAIIRFRTTLRDPRNMVFMFAAIASGIACGVFGFVIAIIGTIGFCLVAFILRFTPFSRTTNMVGSLKFEFAVATDQKTKVDAVLKKDCRRYAMLRYRLKTSKLPMPPMPPVDPLSTEPPPPKPPQGYEDRVEYEYELVLKREGEGGQLGKQLKEIEGIKDVKLSFKHTEDII